MGFLASLFFGFVPMFLFALLIYEADRYEKEPRSLLIGVFLWGAVVAAGAAFLINTVLGMGVYLFTGSVSATELTTGSLIAPIVEESLKGAAVLLVLIIFRSEFDSILDGIIYAAITALGFAATENTFYIYNMGFLESGWAGLFSLVFIRVILVGWQHPFYSAFTGIGLAAARLSPKTMIKFIAPLTGWTIAVFMHAIHNTLAEFLSDISGLLVTTSLDWTGWFLMFLFVLILIRYERGLMVRHLKEEQETGVISTAQYKVACSAWVRSTIKIGALFAGNYKLTNRFYQLCAELAHKKQQYEINHLEVEALKTIGSLRQELAQLSPQL